MPRKPRASASEVKAIDGKKKLKSLGQLQTVWCAWLYQRMKNASYTAEVSEGNIQDYVDKYCKICRWGILAEFRGDCRGLDYEKL